MVPYIFKFIFRSWWRNKLFFVISVLSLAVGLACTNMLLAFVIYESNIEAGNPNKENILYMSQTFPMDTTRTVSYISGNIPQLLKEKYSDVKDYIRFQRLDVQTFSINNKQLSDIALISTDSSFSAFFPYETVWGDISQVFRGPGKIAISEGFAKRVLGDSYPIGQIIRIHFVSDNFTEAKPDTDYEIVAVLKDRQQSFVTFDAITQNTTSFHGGISLLLTNGTVDPLSFGKQLRKDGIPTLQNDVGEYYFSTLQNSYFEDYSNESIPFIKRQHRMLLHSGWISALLILLIACINYINLNYSRLLEQIKRIKVQLLIGASPFQIGLHFFTETFFTILISFFISILIIHDLIPVFNSILSGRLTTTFFFSSQVFPVLLLTLILLSICTALFMTHKLAKAPEKSSFQTQNLYNRYKNIRILSIVQYTISIALLIATITVNKQLGLIKKKGDNYKHVLEVSSDKNNPEQMAVFIERLKEIPEIISVTTSQGSVLNSSIRQLILKDEKGNESYSSLLEFHISSNFMQTLSLCLLQGLSPLEAEKLYARPVYVNREFIDVLVPGNENPIGKPLITFDKDYRERNNSNLSPSKEIAIIAGIVESLHTSSFDNKIQAQAYHIEKSNASLYSLIRFSGSNAELLNIIENIRKEVDPLNNLKCKELYPEYMERNKKTTGFANLLNMYSIISLCLMGFGLFGIAYYATIQRTKEIGIRRVNGATSRQILFLLNIRFIKWILIAFALAVPPVFWALNSWLQYFVYRVEITIDIFLWSGIIITGITLLGVSWHSYRAATSNPVNSLKSE